MALPKPITALIPGPAGQIETEIGEPPGAPRGIAVIAHPHPLMGGTKDNKVVTTLARTFAGLGHIAVRPNFRGVGSTSGTHDDGSF
jgi:alpha/beta superfamily hydrolase